MLKDSKRGAGVPVPSDLQSAVKTLLGSVSEVEAVKRLGVSRISLARLAAGLPVRNGTIASARAGLAKEVA